jgi:anti-repressor protein
MINNIVQVSSLEVSDLNGELVVDSRLIAAQLDLQHETIIKNIRKYAEKFQQMGNLRFEIGTSQPNANGARHQIQFVYLNELQSSFLMTLSKNTEAVVQCKFDLSVAFAKAKTIINSVIPAQNDRIRELELELELRKAEQKLIDTRDTIIKLQPQAIADRILGVTTIEKVEVRTKIVDQYDRILNAADTVTKTELAHRYGFVTKTGKPDTRLVTSLIDEAIASGAISQPWHDIRVVASSGFDADLVPTLDRFHQSSPAQRQRWIGE